MESERYQFMNLSKMPGRLTLQEAAWHLGFAEHDISPLIAQRLLKPLGNPAPNAARHFASSEIERLRNDAKWLDKATAFLSAHWKMKNDAQRSRSGLKRPGLKTRTLLRATKEL